MTLMPSPSCSGDTVNKIGELAEIPGLFDLPSPSFLYHCRICNLYFRRPFLTDEELTEAYRERFEH